LLKLPDEVQRIPVSVQSIAPDALVPETIDAWLQGHDAAMDAISRLVDATPAR
jgi:hypothetical protein